MVQALNLSPHRLLAPINLSPKPTSFHRQTLRDIHHQTLGPHLLSPQWAHILVHINPI